MLNLEIPQLKDIFVGGLAQQGHWTVANLETSIPWPVKSQKVTYLGVDYWIVPVTRESYPAVAIREGGGAGTEARSALLRFLSALAWASEGGIVVRYFTGGNLPRPMGRQSVSGLTIIEELDVSYLPEPTDERGRLALALMREGRGLNHPAYSFLSFYRILEAAIPHGPTRGSWLESNLGRIPDREGREALEQLKATGVPNLADHLYKSGRQAIAHAKEAPIANPDDASDYERLQAELPIMRGVAQLAIEDLLGIKSRQTVYKEHLYELQGFKAALGMEMVQRIQAGGEPDADEVISLPMIDIELRRSGAFQALRGLRPIEAAQFGSMVQVIYGSLDDLVKIRFGLDFGEERLRFNWMEDIGGQDDGTLQAAAYAADVNRFLRDYIGNGELQIFDSETRTLLSRVDAFIPTNYWSDVEGWNKQIEFWQQETARRAGLSTVQATDEPPTER